MNYYRNHPRDYDNGRVYAERYTRESVTHTRVTHEILSWDKPQVSAGERQRELPSGEQKPANTGGSGGRDADRVIGAAICWGFIALFLFVAFMALTGPRVPEALPAPTPIPTAMPTAIPLPPPQVAPVALPLGAWALLIAIAVMMAALLGLVLWSYLLRTGRRPSGAMLCAICGAIAAASAPVLPTLPVAGAVLVVGGSVSIGGVLRAWSRAIEPERRLLPPPR